LIRNHLHSDRRPPGGAGDGPAARGPGSRLADGLWPAALPSAARAAALAALVAASGCGGATAPCPTPPARLDEHRSQAEALQRDLDRVSEEADRLEARREEALERIQEATAREDSLARAAERTAGRRGRR